MAVNTHQSHLFRVAHLPLLLGLLEAGQLELVHGTKACGKAAAASSKGSNQGTSVIE